MKRELERELTINALREQAHDAIELGERRLRRLLRLKREVEIKDRIITELEKYVGLLETMIWHQSIPIIENFKYEEDLADVLEDYLP